MKSTIKYLLILVICSTFSCTNQQGKFDTDITLVIDQTDALTTKFPTAEDITSPFGLSENPWQGIRVLITVISDKDVNQIVLVTIPRASSWMGNVTIRKAQVSQFIKKLAQGLERFKQIGSCPRSIIFRTIALQANRLAALHTERKYLLVYSNLYENSEISFYNPLVICTIQNNPNLIERDLARTTRLGDLEGLQLWLLYNPTNYNENNYYMTIARFYTRIYQAHHSKVEVNNNFQPL